MVASEQLGKGQREKQRKYEQRRRKRLELKQREQEQGSEQPQSVQPVQLQGEQSELLQHLESDQPVRVVKCMVTQPVEISKSERAHEPPFS